MSWATRWKSARATSRRQVTAQIAEMRGKANGHDADASDTLDAATASAAEAAAEVAADVESTAGKAKKAAKDVADEATS